MNGKIQVDSIEMLQQLRSVLVQTNREVADYAACAGVDARRVSVALDSQIAEAHRAASEGRRATSAKESEATRFQAKRAEERIQELASLQAQLQHAIDVFQSVSRTLVADFAVSTAKASTFLANHARSLDGYTRITSPGTVLYPSSSHHTLEQTLPLSSGPGTPTIATGGGLPEPEHGMGSSDWGGGLTLGCQLGASIPIGIGTSEFSPGSGAGRVGDIESDE